MLQHDVGVGTGVNDWNHASRIRNAQKLIFDSTFNL